MSESRMFLEESANPLPLRTVGTEIISTYFEIFFIRNSC